MINAATPLDIVKKEFRVLLPHLDTTGIKHIYTSGSVARNEFNASWSDVDINVVAEAPLSFATLTTLNMLCRKLTDILQCKVGLDFVPYQDILACTEGSPTPEHLADCLGFIKNYHESNSKWLHAGTLYLASDVKIVAIAKRSFCAIPISHYITDLEVQVYETLMRRKEPDGISLHELRILTKACLYLLQTYILSKNGTLLTDYSQLPEASRDYITTDVSFLASIYSAVSSGNSMMLHEGYAASLSKVLMLFNALVREIR